MTTPQPEQSPEATGMALFQALKALMTHASDIAHIKRTFYLAYVSEGFTEAQALELTKNISTF